MTVLTNLKTMIDCGAMSQKDATLQKLEAANDAHCVALRIRATGQAGRMTPAEAIQDLEWARDELLEDAKKIGQEVFSVIISRMPAMKQRASEMRLIAR